MDLRYTADEQQFRAELREWLGDVLPGLGPEPDREDWDARRAWDTGWQRMLFDAGYAGINWPKEFGGRGATPTEHLIFIEETERARAPVRRHELRRPPARRPDAHRRGVRRAEGVPPAGHPQGRARVVPGLLRAQRRLRPRQPAHPRGARRRRLRASTVRRSGPASATWPTTARCSCAPTPKRPKHKGITLADRADGHAGHRHPPARDDGGHRRVLRGVLRRRARPGGQPGRRRERRLARRHGHAELRARHRVRVRRARVDGAGARSRRARQEASRATARPAGRTPGCAARSGASRPSSTRSGRSPSATSRRRSAPAWSVSAATCSRSRGPTCASTSATSPCACSTARRSRSTTWATCRPAEHVHGALLRALDDHRRRARRR